MVYSDIVGHQEAKARLIKMVNEKRIPHALLFTGQDGGGNLPAALVFAQHLLCSQPTPDGPCAHCSACSRVAKLVHPDLHLVFPIAKSKHVKSSDSLIKTFREHFLNQPYTNLNDWFLQIDAENKQPIIPVEESADILRKLSYTSYEGSYKIMVIWHPEKMNTESANRLLKILEEPPDKTIFILVSCKPDQLLATIISRVQQVPFFKADEEEVAQALVRQYQVDSQAAKQAAMLSGGVYGEAQKLLHENDEGVSFLNQFQSFMRLGLRFDAIKAMDWVEDFAKAGREKHKQFLLYGLEVFRDALMYTYGDKSLVRLSGQERAFLEKFAPFVHLNNYERLVEEFNSNYQYIERNANPKIVFTDLIFQINELLNLKAPN